MGKDKGAEGDNQVEDIWGKRVQAERTASAKALWYRSTEAKGLGGGRGLAGDEISFIAGSDRKRKVA